MTTNNEYIFIVRLFTKSSRIFTLKEIEELYIIPILKDVNAQFVIPIHIDDRTKYHWLEEDLEKKLNVFFKLYYGTEVGVTIIELDTIAFSYKMNVDEFVKKIRGKMWDLDDSEYLKNPIDPAHKELYETFVDILEKRMMDGFPKLVMWIDKYVANNSSGFCDIRNSCIHPNLFEKSKKRLESKYPNELEFENDNSLTRDSQKNVDFLKRKLPELLNEVREQFTKKYFTNEKSPNQHIC